MSIDTQSVAVRQAILAFATKIKQISEDAKNAETADLAANSSKLEGLTLNEVVELIAGTTGLTVQAVLDQLDAHELRSDNPHSVTKAQTGLGNVENYGVATNAEAEDNLVTDKYLTPKGAWHLVDTFWASVVGAAPETLDTIAEIAAALQGNPDVITAIQDSVASKASTVDLNAAVSTLEDQITNATTVYADNAEALAGTETGKAMNPATTKAVVDAAKSDLQTQIDAKASNAALGILQTQVDDLDKADVGLGSVENFGVATEAEALETDPLTAATNKYMTPQRSVQMRAAIETGVEQQLVQFASDIETAFTDALALLDPPVDP